MNSVNQLTEAEVRALCAVAGVRCNMEFRPREGDAIYLPYMCEIDDYIYVGFGETADEAAQQAWNTYANHSRD